MSDPDAMTRRIGQAIELGRRGERAAARELFAALWAELGDTNGDPLHHCMLAHHMADTQHDVQEELVWDLRALRAADLVTDERATQAGATGTVAGFYPSLQLNVAECYRKLGCLDEAREHLRRGDDAISALGDDGYGEMIRGGLARLSERLTSEAKEPTDGKESPQ